MVLRRKHWLGSFLALTGMVLAVCLMLVSSAAAATTACGDVVTSDLTLENDLIGCPGDGLIVGASGITIDLNGHTISGIGTGIGVTVGRSFFDVDDVSVIGGVVRGFETGIWTGGAHNLLLSGLTVRDNGIGIRLDAGTRSLVTKNQLLNNEDTGLTSGIPGSNVIRNNVAIGNGRIGLNIAEDSAFIIEGNFASHNGFAGIVVGDSVSHILDNTMLHNGTYGLFVHERIPSFVAHYVVADNVANANGTAGIYFEVCCASPTSPPVESAQASGNAAKNNGEFECKLAGVSSGGSGTIVRWVDEDWTCARNRGQARSGVVAPATRPLHSSALGEPS